MFQQPHVASSYHIGQHGYRLCSKIDDKESNDSRDRFGQHINSPHPAFSRQFCTGKVDGWRVVGYNRKNLITQDSDPLTQIPGRQIVKNLITSFPSPTVVWVPAHPLLSTTDRWVPRPGRQRTGSSIPWQLRALQVNDG